MFLQIITIIIYGNIENEIRRLEKSFSKKDIKDFKQKFEKDFSSKKYELESSKVYESASNQIELKKDKFYQVSQKMINDYGKKYNEILSKDISEEEKHNLLNKLLEETKSYDEKNRQVVFRLNSEYENLTQNFKGKVEKTSTIYEQMQNLHLFDKNRYFEDMKASIKPELRDLYKKRYLLNSYRIKHNEIVHNGKQNIISDFANTIINKLKNSNPVPKLGPHFERDIPNQYIVNADEIDKNLIKALAAFYSNNVIQNRIEFEDYLVDYFRKHYKELLSPNSTQFLQNFSRSTINNESHSFEEGDLFKIARFFGISSEFLKLQSNVSLVVKDGLIYEVCPNSLNIIYSTDKAIKAIVNDLYGEFLYYKHLANANNLVASNIAILQNSFLNYAKQKEIEIENNLTTKTTKRYVKKKSKKDAQSNVVDFKSQSC